MVNGGSNPLTASKKKILTITDVFKVMSNHKKIRLIDKSLRSQGVEVISTFYKKVHDGKTVNLSLKNDFPFSFNIKIMEGSEIKHKIKVTNATLEEFIFYLEIVFDVKIDEHAK